ncbi:MAG: SDR family NAD(P)-dependent oxidoreductase [Fimbriimonas sp.]|nr:SDR family NAD(P)-dependent oxidoreductase [Fimbriimonas sp.]
MRFKRVLVTGSSRGIGRAIAQRLAQTGWSVAIHYTASEKEAAQTERLLGSACSGVYRADLSAPSKAKGLIEAALADGPLQALVNNAGVYMPLDFIQSGDAAFSANFHKTFSINFESPVAMMRAAAKHFDQNGGGKILNVASRVGFKGEGGAALYASSKAALINLTRSLAVELAPRNIQLFGIAPGWVDTAMVREGMNERLAEINESIPLGRMATPKDCAATAAFLLSDDAAYLSGVVIDINGASYFH